MNEPLVIEIPGTVDSRLAGNGVRKTHWGTRGRLNAELKDRAGWATKKALEAAPFVVDAESLRIDYTVGWGYNERSLDDDNFVTAMKGVRDIIANIIGIDDRLFITGTVTQERDPAKRGYIVVRIASVVEEQAA